MRPFSGRVPGLILLYGTRIAFYAVILLAAISAASAAQSSGPRFEISFPASVHAGPITGRVFVVISLKENPAPRIQAAWFDRTPPLFGADVDHLGPGENAVIDSSALGFPLRSLADVPAGDYYVQAILNVYTQFHRADGHTIWAHMDQWEGQQFNTSPGNLYSDVQKVHLDSIAGYNFNLRLTEIIPPITLPEDTAWVKHIKIQSALLSKFWGRPIYLGATVLLPQGYDTHPAIRYPVLYWQDHFTLGAPFGFRADSATLRKGREDSWSPQYALYQAWTSPGFPRMVIVQFQHPTPFFDDSYAVNSANNGPYGDALLQEMIPYLEQHFRILAKPYARVLGGGSTGGWESLALQIHHADFFGGTWTFFPDPVDFRHYGLTNVYSDDNAFTSGSDSWLKPERYIMRAPDGQPILSTRMFSQLESVLGSHGRSGQQLEAWESVYAPVGPDGYPMPVWDKLTGKINHTVAIHMRDHGYDLRYYLDQNWATLGPSLQGKLRLYVGDMDSFYLNLAVYDLQDFLKGSSNPHYEGFFQYGRPMKPHGWHPMSVMAMLREMANQITQNAPTGEDTSAWKY
jgi:Putative esterase